MKVRYIIPFIVITALIACNNKGSGNSSVTDSGSSVNLNLVNTIVVTTDA